jgi:hypothetical protein
MRGYSALALLLGATLTGCYSYLPTTPQALVPATEVRVRPTLEYRAGLRDLLGTEPTTLEGTVVGSGEGEMTIEIVTAGIQYGARARPLTQRIAVPWTQVLEVEEKRLDRARTTGVLAAAGGLAVAAVVYLIRLEAGGTPDGPPDGGDEARLPLPARFP